MSLIEISPEIHDVAIELAYATANNVTAKPIYARADCYLHADAVAALGRAVALARPLGLGLKIFDAFRPSEAQWKLWEARPDPEFIADPRRGSPHSRGVAVDLTLIEDGIREFDMGTGFDAFTPLSHHANTGVSQTAQRNRLLLLGLMTAAGWDFYDKEWWHYQLPGASDYPLLGDAVLPRPMMRA